ncbi:MAG: CvpA family protein [Burkholderiaceae bacterium]
MTFTTIDILVALILLASMLISIMRGFTREVLSLANWVVAFYLAHMFAPQAAALMPSFVIGTLPRLTAGFLTVLIAALFVGSIVNWVIGKLVLTSGALRATDRTLGTVFGFVRGCVIVMTLAVLASLTGVPKQDGWKNAASVPVVVAAVQAVKPMLPPAVADQVKF